MNPKSIFIGRIELPNDPTTKSAARQYLVIEDETSYFFFLTTSSVLGKEDRVYGEKGKINDINVNIVIKGDMQINNKFFSPTFIDCNKRYKIIKDGITNFDELFIREVTENLWKLVQNKINELKDNDITPEEFEITDIAQLKLLNRFLR